MTVEMFLRDGPEAFGGSLFRQGWARQVIYAVHAKACHCACIWIFAKREEDYLLWATSTDGSIELCEVVDKAKADCVHRDFLKVLDKDQREGKLTYSGWWLRPKEVTAA